jgi:hypothetical protein
LILTEPSSPQYGSYAISILLAKSEIYMMHVWWAGENWGFHHTGNRENDFAIRIGFGEMERSWGYGGMIRDHDS